MIYRDNHNMTARVARELADIPGPQDERKLQNILAAVYDVAKSGKFGMKLIPCSGWVHRRLRELGFDVEWIMGSQYSKQWWVTWEFKEGQK